MNEEEKDVNIVECKFEYKCPQKWENLRDIGQKDMRFCDACKDLVYFADTDWKLQQLKREGKCVAVWQDNPDYNLRPVVTMGIPAPDSPGIKGYKPSAVCDRCGAKYPPSEKFCGRCGSSLKKN